MGFKVPGLAIAVTVIIVGSMGRAQATSESVLYTFSGGADGGYPEAPVILLGKKLYTTTSGGGGASGAGTVFETTLSGAGHAIYAFKGAPDGASPLSGLTAIHGVLYGTTYDGGNQSCQLDGVSDCGTVFAVTPKGKEQVVYAFKGGSDGANPDASLIQSAGTLFGTTSSGAGTGCGGFGVVGCGAVFSLTTSGSESLLYAFQGGTDGGLPGPGALVKIGGNFYGTTIAFGNKKCTAHLGCGTVYSISPSGSLNTLYTFTGGTDGASPNELVAVGSTLFGTTIYGGNGSNGTVFELSLAGKETVLYRFSGQADGSNPNPGMANLNGTLYGTTANGGANGCGTVFSVSSSGTVAAIYSFGGQANGDGCNPRSGLVNVNGTLYGTTSYGGASDVGTIYKFVP
jgi:uncharacterized repeat protein (TIGR03803 family)